MSTWDAMTATGGHWWFFGIMGGLAVIVAVGLYRERQRERVRWLPPHRRKWR